MSTEDRLCFFSKSKDVLPGKGVQEFAADVEKYDDLADILNWRHVLSNFHVATNPIEYGGYHYRTIEHVFQGAKINLKDPEKALYFSIESGHDIGKGDGFAAQKQRKYVKLDDAALRQWDTLGPQVMRDAAAALYGNPENIIERTVLLATRDAQLFHIRIRQPSVRFEHLEAIRLGLFLDEFVKYQQTNMLDRTKCSMTARNVYNHLTGSDDMVYNNNLCDMQSCGTHELAVEMRNADCNKVYYVHFDHITGDTSHYFILLQLHGRGVIVLQSAVFEFSIHDWLYPDKMVATAKARSQVMQVMDRFDESNNNRSKIVREQLERDLERERETSLNIKQCRFSSLRMHAVEDFVMDFVGKMATLEGEWSEQNLPCSTYRELFGCRLEHDLMIKHVRDGCKPAAFKYVSNVLNALKFQT